jgi:hypothetical protein
MRQPQAIAKAEAVTGTRRGWSERPRCAYARLTGRGGTLAARMLRDARSSRGAVVCAPRCRGSRLSTKSDGPSAVVPSGSLRQPAPDRAAGPEAEGRWLALTKLNTSVADCVNVRPRGRGPRAALPGVAARAYGRARVADAFFAGGSARPRAGAFCGTPPRASTQGDPRRALAPWGARALFRISGRRAGCPSGRPCARSSRPPCRRTGSGRRTRCGPRRCRLASARSS